MSDWRGAVSKLQLRSNAVGMADKHKISCGFESAQPDINYTLVYGYPWGASEDQPSKGF
ncbi:hypothetical protein GCM10009119_18120 [Algoriphagus jejuensis]|uniref:Uncharacterized protein n=1 Tax=Algoriphagus jejuensis TaxID=419934 RepID=A0ABN1MZB4_9BACT